MKKTLHKTCTPVIGTAQPIAPRPLWLRLGSALALLGLLSGLGLLASRPAHTAGGPIPVTVANSQIATTPTDNPDKQGVQFEATLFINSNAQSSATQNVYTVPAGKRLVIETVSAITTFLRDPNHYTVTYGSNGGLGSKKVTGAFDLLPDGAAFSSIITQTHQYAEAGTTVTAQLFRPETAGAGQAFVTYTGYLVDIVTPGGSS